MLYYSRLYSGLLTVRLPKHFVQFSPLDLCGKTRMNLLANLIQIKHENYHTHTEVNVTLAKTRSFVSHVPYYT